MPGLCYAGDPAAGGSRPLRAKYILQTLLNTSLLKTGVLGATFSKLQIRMPRLTWGFCLVTKYMRCFVRHMVGIKLPGTSGTFFHRKESEYLKSRKSLILKDLRTRDLWQIAHKCPVLRTRVQI